MLRSEIINGCHLLVQLIKTSNLEESIDKAFEDNKKIPTPTKEINQGLLKSFSLFSIGYNDLDSVTKKIGEIMGLNKYIDTDNWIPLLRGNTPRLMNLHSVIRFTKENLPKIVMMLDNEDYTTIKTENENLLLVFPEGVEELSNLERISEGLFAIELLKRGLIEFLKINEQDLVVVSIDSGSDKQFNLKGSGELIKEIKELILSMWDRIVTYKGKKTSEYLDNIAKSLPIIEKIAEMQSSGTISPESAELMKRNIVQGVGKLISSGAIIPEQGDYKRFEPRKLMAPEQKLITSTLPNEKIESELGTIVQTNQDVEDQTDESIECEKGSSSREIDIGELSNEEIMTILALRKK